MHAPTSIPGDPREIAGHPGHPGAVGVGRDAEEVDDAPFHFDHEEYVVAAEKLGIDGEEVGRDDAFGLGAEELGPGRAGSPWRWRKPMAAQDIGDAALGDGDAELLQVACDAQVAPAGVLPGESDDQVDGLLKQAALVLGAGGSSAVGRAPGASAPDRLGRDEEGRPPLSWHDPGQGGDQCSVGPTESGS